jgi:hypothetical protein
VIFRDRGLDEPRDCRRRLAKHPLCTQIPITVERFKFELNRKKSKFERYRLITTADAFGLKSSRANQHE